MRNGDGWFSTDQVQRLYEDLRIPKVSSLNRILGQLRSQRLVTNRASECNWSLTPLGVQRVLGLMVEFDDHDIGPSPFLTPGADFANVRHTVIPPSFAPAKWQSGIGQLLERFPFESNVFCMTRFPSTRETDIPDPLHSVIEAIREATNLHGLTLHLASDRVIEEDLWGNVVAHLWACQYGIGLLDGLGNEAGKLNSNMLIELGSMLTMGRRCAILKDKSAEKPPTDLSGHIYKSADFHDPRAVSNAIHLWISEDLALGPCSKCPPAPHAVITEECAADLSSNRNVTGNGRVASID